MKIASLINTKSLKWGLLISIVMIVFLTWLANYLVEKGTDSLVFTNTDEIPSNRVGLLLGTSRDIRPGMPNKYFDNRIDAAFSLLNSGKIQRLVISGDNSRKNYNEPQDMKNALVAKGIAPHLIYLDYAGFSTYESIIRMNKIFSQTKFTVISQEFHNRRAVFIAKKLNLDAIGYNAADVHSYGGFKTKLREKLARVKVFIDIWFESKPTFLGEKVLVE